MTDPSAREGSGLPTRRAGSGELAVSAVGLGCMGMSEFYGASDDARSAELLREAIDLGVTFFDTADIYGFGDNERLVGGVLAASAQRDRLVLATKCGILRDRDDPAKRGVDNSPAYIREACARSLDRLGTRIDLYYLHRIADDGERIEESMEAMAEMIRQGSIRHAGLSEPSARTVRRAHAALLDLTGGRQGLGAVQTEYSLVSRGPEQDGVLEACRELGILFVPYSPLGRGLLSGVVSRPDDLAPDDFRRSLPRFQGANLEANLSLVDVVRQAAGRLGATPGQVALAWVLGRGDFIAPIPGTRRSDRLRENLAAARLELPPDILAALEAALPPGAASGTRYAPEAMAAYGLTR